MNKISIRENGMTHPFVMAGCRVVSVGLLMKRSEVFVQSSAVSIGPCRITVLDYSQAVSDDAGRVDQSESWILIDLTPILWFWCIM